MEEEDRDFTEEEDTEERRPHKGGRISRFEPTNTRELMASPVTVNCFKHKGCFDYCVMVQRVQCQPEDHEGKMENGVGSFESPNDRTGG